MARASCGNAAGQDQGQKVKHHAALPYADVPAFMVKLRANDSISARALEFTILNANRTGEVHRREVG